MKARMFLLGLALSIGAAYAGYTIWSRPQATGMPKAEPVNEDSSQISHLIEEQLKEHAGEVNPIVMAFEDALESETKLEERMAHDLGLKVPQS